MPESQRRERLLLPPGTRLLHIGPPKTGTSALQTAANRARPALHEAGVLYPGNGKNHRIEFCAFMGLPDSLISASHDHSIPLGATRRESVRVPSMSEWNSLMADIESEPSKRVLLSHESAASASAAMARKFVRRLGKERVHVVITLRSLPAMLSSRWAERLKSGASDTLEDWLKRVYEQSQPPIAVAVRRTLDLAGLVERWAAVAGPENVTAIVADRTDGNLLTDTFEEMLGLPERTLTGAVSGGRDTNRSMTQPEAELFRRLNAALSGARAVPWPLYLYVVRGAVAQVLGRRIPDDEEQRVWMPRWAAELAVRDGKRHSERIADSGVRVVGRLENLYERPVIEDVATDDERWPSSLAVEALTGAVLGARKAEQHAAREIARARGAGASVASGGGAVSDGQPGLSRAQKAAAVYTTHELLYAMSIRLRHRLRTRRSKPVEMARHA